MNSLFQKNTTDVKSFLGLAGYYRKFIPQFIKIAKPLNDLLKKDVTWKWGQDQIDSFQSLGTALTQEPVLQYPDFTKPFVLTCDASGYAVGAILSQGEIGQDKPICFASRTLNKAEQNYSTIEELTAIVCACRHFRPYLLGRPFTIVTDHKPLTWTFSVKDPSSRLLKWRLLLEEYEYCIEYKAGKKNVNADDLSRNPVVLTTMITSKEKQQKIVLEMHECPTRGTSGRPANLRQVETICYMAWNVSRCRLCYQLQNLSKK
jgi:hypothetical protein